MTQESSTETIIPLGDWLQLDLNEWECAIVSPSLNIDDLSCFQLTDTQGLLLKLKPSH